MKFENATPEQQAEFSAFWLAYTGKKRAIEREFLELSRHPGWESVLPLLVGAAKKYAKEARGYADGTAKTMEHWLAGGWWEAQQTWEEAAAALTPSPVPPSAPAAAPSSATPVPRPQAEASAPESGPDRPLREVRYGPISYDVLPVPRD